MSETPQNFQPEIWEHVVSKYLKMLSSTDQNEIRKSFRDETMKKTWVINYETCWTHPKWRGRRIGHAGHNLQWKKNGLRDRWGGLTFEITRRKQNPRKTNRYTESATSNPSSNDNDSTRSNIGDEVPSPFSLRPSSAPGPITETRKEMNDIKDLQLSPNQGKGSHDTSAGKSLILSPINLLKRRTVTKSDPSGTLLNTANHRLASNQRTKTLSGEPFVNKKKNPNFRREIANPNESNTDRNSNDLAKCLFDPNTDNPSSVLDFRSNKQDPTTYPRWFYHHKAHVFRSKRTSVGDNGDLKYKIMINSSLNNEDSIKRFVMSSSQPVQLKERRVKLSNKTNSKHFDEYADPNLELEILLRPKTRPISHD